MPGMQVALWKEEALEAAEFIRGTTASPCVPPSPSPIDKTTEQRALHLLDESKICTIEQPWVTPSACWGQICLLDGWRSLVWQYASTSVPLQVRALHTAPQLGIPKKKRIFDQPN